LGLGASGADNIARWLQAESDARTRSLRCYLKEVTNAVWEFPLILPRNAFTAREVPRAADVWRLCQDAATLASINSGWPASRFAAEGVAFIVYKQTVVHDAETPYGAVLDTKTWVSRFRRRTLTAREVRIQTDGERVAAATQEWVHVDGDTLKPKQSSVELGAAFPVVDLEPSVTLPKFDELPGAVDEFAFDMWQTWSDPLAHANHPDYIGWCDEATSRRMVARGIEPVLLRPVAEQVTFRLSVLPGERVTVRTKRIGAIGSDAVVLMHHLETDRGTAADATSVRALADGSTESLISAWD
jgi:acyl-CoA thioesterase FadM